MNKIENKETIAGLKSTIKVMTQRVNGLNTPFKRKKEILMDLIKKLTSNIWYIEETQRERKLKLKEKKSCDDYKRERMVLLISGKTYNIWKLNTNITHE